MGIVELTPEREYLLVTEFFAGAEEISDRPSAPKMRRMRNDLPDIAPSYGWRRGHVGERASNSIPTTAQVSIDLRLVPAQTPERAQSLVEAHIRKQGYYIVRQTPDEALRAAHPKIAKVVWGPGYPAARTAMDHPISKKVIQLVDGAVLLPTLGGSIPMYLFQREGTVPVIGVPIVNHDNNQHAANENLRLQNLWDGIALYEKLVSGL